jgi:serine/threonine protein kinase
MYFRNLTYCGKIILLFGACYVAGCLYYGGDAKSKILIQRRARFQTVSVHIFNVSPRSLVKLDMELAGSVQSYICPTAAFLDPSGCLLLSGAESELELSRNPNASEVTWENSTLNPRNRFDDLSPTSSSRWRIDGCTLRGTQFFALPTFMMPQLAPMRIDVFIPDQSKHPPPLRPVLQSAAAPYVPGSRINELGIAQVILRVLDCWVEGQRNFENVFRAMPFGSRIALENITSNIREIKVRFIPILDTQRKFLSIEALQAMWNLPKSSWPSSVDLDALEHEAQLHDTVSLVRIPKLYGSRSLIFKSMLHETKYMYHELKLLLTMPAHTNIIAKPEHIVVRKDDWNVETKVLGFILEYHHQGALGNIIASRSRRGVLRFNDQIRWAKQITAALIAIHKGPARFYSELKPNNLLVSDPGDNIIFIDFEQSGNWETFSAPEIHHLENLSRLATSDVVPESKKAYYGRMLQEHLPKKLESGPTYTNPPEGYFDIWNALLPEQREASSVYALGKTLWCIFESCSHTANSTQEEYTHEAEREFPEFSKTPSLLRELIRDCTRGSTDFDHGRRDLVLKGSRFYPRGRTGEGGEPVATAMESVVAAKAYWSSKVEEMESYLNTKLRWDRGVGTKEDGLLLGFPLRPRLQDVLDVLSRQEKEVEKARNR